MCVRVCGSNERLRDYQSCWTHNTKAIGDIRISQSPLINFKKDREAPVLCIPVANNQWVKQNQIGNAREPQNGIYFLEFHSHEETGRCRSTVIREIKNLPVANAMHNSKTGGGKAARTPWCIPLVKVCQRFRALQWCGGDLRVNRGNWSQFYNACKCAESPALDNNNDAVLWRQTNASICSVVHFSYSKSPIVTQAIRLYPYVYDLIWEI